MKTTLLVATYVVFIVSTAQRDCPTVRYYTPDGRAAGSATTTSSGRTTYYGPDGRIVGTSSHQRGARGR